MPAFRKPNCLWKITGWTVLFIVISMLLTYKVGELGGLLGATMTLLVSVSFSWYLMDRYGDLLFTHKDYQPNEEFIKKHENHPFINSINQ